VLTTEEIEKLCAAGSFAPSGGNAQPWRVTVSDGRMEIGVDPDRGSFLDVGGYAALFAVGGFAENVGIAAGTFGLSHNVTVDDDGTAVVTFTGRHDPARNDLYDSIPERVTNRRLHEGAPLAETDVQRLVDAAGAMVAVSTMSTVDGKRAVAEALGAADALRMRHPVMFADMVREMRWSARETQDQRDGLDLGTLELPAGTIRLLSLLRRFPWLRRLLPAGRLGDTARTLVQGCSHVCCLAVAGPAAPWSMVVAGMAMQRLWLTATRDGISVHPWTVSTLQLVRLESFGGEGFSDAEREAVKRMGADLRAAFGLEPAQTPVFVFRLSKAPPPTARSLRRPWQSYTTIGG
jgi:nitroreductase